MTSPTKTRRSWGLASRSAKELCPNPQSKIYTEEEYLQAHLAVLSGQRRNSPMRRVTDLLSRVRSAIL
jgi:hypothetical protein